MTSSLLMPRGRVRTRGSDLGEAAGSTAPTRILDWRHPNVSSLLRRLDLPTDTEDASDACRTATLRQAHRRIATAVRPVYSVQDERPVSEVLRRGRGSCSQRLAVLEAVARATGVATRVRGLLVDGSFWHPRFPRIHRLVPHQVVLAWPEFHIEGPPRNGRPTAPWLTVSELFGDLDELNESTSPTPARRHSSRRCPGRRSTGTVRRSARPPGPRAIFRPTSGQISVTSTHVTHSSPSTGRPSAERRDCLPNPS